MSTSVPEVSQPSTRKQLKVVNINDLKIDRSYQRDLNQKWVEDILSNMDEMAIDPLTVSKRENGDLYLVNGQHRSAARRLMSVFEMDAFVYEGLTPAQEAALRLKANHSKPDTVLDKFHTRISANDPEAIAINAIVEEFGGHINRIMNKTTGVNAVGAFQRIYRQDHGALLRQTLKLIYETFGRVGGDPVKAPVVTGIALFLREHPDVYRGELRRRLASVGLDPVMQRAYATQTAMGGPLSTNVYRALVETWNYKRQAKYRIEWTRRGQDKTTQDHKDESV